VFNLLHSRSAAALRTSEFLRSLYKETVGETPVEPCF